MATQIRSNLTAEAWAEAALEVIASDGFDAVAIEPLARQLGVTKGSFYWHFSNREALLRAALQRWEKAETVDILARAGPEADPYQRIVKLFKAANSSYRAGRLYLAIAAAEDKPMVQVFVRRVSEQRLRYLFDCYCALGYSAAQAKHWARFAYATYMGNLQISRDTPELMPGGSAYGDYVKLMIQTLIPQPPALRTSGA